MTDPSTAEEIAARVTDGGEVDWDAALSSLGDRALVEQLRVLDAIGRAGRPLDATRPLLELRRWGPFEILDPISAGAYGVVLRARDSRVDREVALKLLPDAPWRDDQRFLDEARALARVKHPNIVAVYGADRFEDVPGLWMELVRGFTLEQSLSAMGPFGAREATLVGVEICGALSAVHAAGLVHRDLKLRNVIRERGGRIVLVDFGGVRPASGPSGHMGTPLFMAPELFEGAGATPNTDLYALGVVLFALVSGEYPAQGDSASRLRDAHRRGERRLVRDVRPEIPESLANVIDRAVAPDPGKRFKSAGEFRSALITAFDLGLAPGGVRPAWLRVPRPVPAWLFGGLTVAIGLLVLAAPTAWQRLRDRGRPPGPSLSEEAWQLVAGQRELGDAQAERGEWGDAAVTYGNAAAVFTRQFGEMSPAAVPDQARAALATASAGRHEQADRDYVYVLYRLSELAGPGNPLAASVEAARAVSLQQRGRFQEAAEALLRAIHRREQLFGTAGLAGEGYSGTVSVAKVTDALRAHPLDRDSDNDWLPDPVEVALGSDPYLADSDGDGFRDDVEDTDGDGVGNGLEWGVVPDPRLVVGTVGPVDPRDLGARVGLAGTAGPAPSPGRLPRAWRLRSPRSAFYALDLTDRQKRWAMARGWRLYARARVTSGQGFVVVDLLPRGRSFAINLFAEPGGQVLRLFQRTMPRESLDFTLGPDVPVPVIALQYDPVSQRASLTIGSQLRTVDYAGLTDMQLGRGLLWGVTNNLGAAPIGDALFEVVGLEIKP